MKRAYFYIGVKVGAEGGAPFGEELPPVALLIPILFECGC